jgi:hypothetical protein
MPSRQVSERWCFRAQQAQARSTHSRLSGRAGSYGCSARPHLHVAGSDSYLTQRRVGEHPGSDTVAPLADSAEQGCSGSAGPFDQVTKLCNITKQGIPAGTSVRSLHLKYESPFRFNQKVKFRLKLTRNNSSLSEGAMCDRIKCPIRFCVTNCYDGGLDVTKRRARIC